MNKTERITFRITPEIKAYLEDTARKQDWTVGVLLNCMIKKAKENDSNERTN